LLNGKPLSSVSFDDIEDCLQSECAVSIGADYIVTRNIGDFTDSPVPVILPADFLSKLAAELRE
jgi:hypothetical protein